MTETLAPSIRSAPERAIAALGKVRHFADLPRPIQEALAQVAVPRRFAAGEIIYLEGEPCTTVYILESGWVRATRMSPQGREQAMLFLHPGEVFGDIAVFTGNAYPGTVIALEDVEVWTVDGDVLLDLIGRHAELALAVIRRLADRVLYFIELVEDISLRSVESRLTNTLLKHAERSQGRLVVPRRAWTTFDEMATRLGTVRDVLSRTLRSLEEEGLLRVERTEIVLLDPEGLAERSRP